MTRPTLEERRQRRQTERLIDHVTAGWWLQCPTHGRSPVDWLDSTRCFYCKLEAETGKAYDGPRLRG